MIYIVDEDRRQLRAEKSELEFRGFEVEFLGDADIAFSTLISVKPKDVDLILIDVMLAANEDSMISRYSRSSSDNFMKTGLLLLKDLIQQNKKVFPSKAVLFTNTTSDSLLSEVRNVCTEYKIELISKREYRSTFEFGDKIESFIKNMKE